MIFWRTFRSAWLGALVYGLLGPLFSAIVPIMVPTLYAFLERGPWTRHGDAVGAFETFAALSGIAIALSGVPCLLTGLVTAFWRQRLDGRRIAIRAMKLEMILHVAWLLVLSSFVCGPDWVVPWLVSSVLLCVAATWSVACCEALMARLVPSAPLPSRDALIAYESAQHARAKPRHSDRHRWPD